MELSSIPKKAIYVTQLDTLCVFQIHMSKKRPSYNKPFKLIAFLVPTTIIYVYKQTNETQ